MFPLPDFQIKVILPQASVSKKNLFPFLPASAGKANKRVTRGVVDLVVG